VRVFVIEGLWGYECWKEEGNSPRGVRGQCLMSAAWVFLRNVSRNVEDRRPIPLINE
jgi:hypothetical protein